jgi:hypothetical protein
VTVRLYSADGTPQDLDAEQASQAFGEGALGLRRGERVPVMMDGRFGTVASDDESLQSLIRNGQARFATPEEQAAEVERERLAQPAQQIRAFGEGVGRQLPIVGAIGEYQATSDNPLVRATGYLNPVAAPSLLAQEFLDGDMTQEERNADRLARANTDAGRIGELAGAAGTALIPIPGAGAAAGAASAGARGLLSGIGRVATREAVEGALYGAQTVLTEDALGRAELTGERLAAGTIMGGLLSAGGAAGLRVAGRGVAAAARPVTDAVGPAMQRSLAELAELVSPEGIARASERQAFRSLGGIKRYARIAERRGGEEVDGIANVGEVILRRNMVTRTTSVEDSARLLRREVRVAGAEVGAVIDEIAPLGRLGTDPARVMGHVNRLSEALRTGLTKTAGDLADRVDGFLEPFQRRYLGQVSEVVVDGQRRIRAVFPEASGRGTQYFRSREVALAAIKEAEEAIPFNARDLHTLRSSIDDTGFRGENNPRFTPIEKELQALRAAVEEDIQGAIVRGSKELGDPGMLERYALAKNDYGALVLARDTAADTLHRAGANRSYSLSDYITMGSVTAAASAAIPIPGAGLAVGFIGGLVNKWARENMPRLAAVEGSRLAKLEGVRTTAAALSNAIERAAGAFTRGATGAARGASRLPKAAGRVTAEATWDRVSPLLATFDASSPATAEALGEAVSDATDGAPQSAAHAQLTALRGMQFLQAQMPRRNLPSLLPHLARNVRPSQSEMQTFARYVRAVEDPASVIEDLESGSITAEGVRALREVYPEMYQEVVREVVEALAEAEREPDYATKLRLSILLGIPFDASLQPAFIARMQSSYSPPQGEPSTAAPAPVARESSRTTRELISSSTTVSQRLRAS